MTRGGLLRIIAAITLAAMIRKILGTFAQCLTYFAPFWVNASSVLAALCHSHLSALVDIKPLIRSCRAEGRHVPGYGGGNMGSAWHCPMP
jgi:hypothetical protein